MSCTLVVSTTFPQYPADPRGRFVVHYWRRRMSPTHRVEFLVPRTRWSRPGVDAGGPIARFHYAPTALATLTGRFGILENIRERPGRALWVPSLLVGLAHALRRRLARGDVDHVAAHMCLPGGWVVAELCHAVGVPFSVYGHGTDVDVALRLPGPLRWRLAAALSRADTLSVPSADKARRVRAELSRTLSVTVEPMLTAIEAPAAAAPRVGRDILFVGRLIRQKGVDDLLEAVRRMDAPPRLHVAGDGPDRPRLERLARRYGLRATFHGYVEGPAKEALFAKAAVVCVPSRPTRWGLSEGAPLVIREAFARSVPVVATRVGGIPEVCGGGEGADGAAILVPAGDPGALARALAEATAEPVHEPHAGVLQVARALA